MDDLVAYSVHDATPSKVLARNCSATYSLRTTTKEMSTEHRREFKTIIRLRLNTVAPPSAETTHRADLMPNCNTQQDGLPMIWENNLPAKKDHIPIPSVDIRSVKAGYYQWFTRIIDIMLLKRSSFFAASLEHHSKFKTAFHLIVRMISRTVHTFSKKDVRQG